MRCHTKCPSTANLMRPGARYGCGMGEDPSRALRPPFWPAPATARAGEPGAPKHALPSARLGIVPSEASSDSPPITAINLASRRQGARSKSGISPQRPCFTVSCDDWTFHSMEFFFSGRQPADVLREVKASPLHPEVHSRWFRDPLSGRPRVRGYSVIAHFSSPETTQLLPLREIADHMDASLREFPWLCDPRLSVSRLDLASDHLVSAPPGRCATSSPR